MKRIIIVILLVSSVVCNAQQRHVWKFRTINGTIANKDNKPAGNVTVLFAGTNMGSTSDIKGNFKLHFPDVPVMVTVYNKTENRTYYIKVNPDQQTLNIKFDKALSDLSEKSLAEWNKNKPVFANSISQAVQSEEFYAYVHNGATRPTNDVTIDERVNETAQSIDTSRVYTAVQKTPSLGGDFQGWAKYVKSNLKYPDKAKADELSGKVIIAFLVERDGRLTHIRIARSLSPECDQEAMRLIQSCGKWEPAIEAGVKVKCEYAVPVTFGN